MREFREFVAAAHEELGANLAAFAGQCEDRTRRAVARGDEELLARELMAQAVAIGALYRHFRNVVVRDPTERVILDGIAECVATEFISVPSAHHTLQIKR